MFFSSAQTGSDRLILPSAMRVDIRRVGKKGCVFTYSEDVEVPSKMRTLGRARDTRTALQIGKDTLDVIRQMVAQTGQKILASKVTKVGTRSVRLMLRMEMPFADACSGVVTEFLVQSSLGDVTLKDLIKASAHSAAIKAQALAQEEYLTRTLPPPTKSQLAKARRAEKEHQERRRLRLIDRGVAGGASREVAETFVKALLSTETQVQVTLPPKTGRVLRRIGPRPKPRRAS